MLFWYTFVIPEEKNFIDQKEAEQYVRKLVGKPARLSCGYGGVLFLEAGELKDEEIPGRVPPLFRGTYRLFCNEKWEFIQPSGEKIARFTSSSTKDDEVFWNMGAQTIEKIEIERAFEKIGIYFSGGYQLMMIKDDELETFHLTLESEKKYFTYRATAHLC